MKGNWKDCLYIIVGTGLFAFVVQSILDPQGMVMGGFTGISIIVKELGAQYGLSVPVGLTNTVLNVPLFLAAWKKLGWRFISRSFGAAMLVSLWLFVLPAVPLIKGDMILSALFGGLLSGTGLGLVLRTGATTGGSDMLATVLKPFFPGVSVVVLFHVMDGVIVLAGAFVFGIPMALYAIAALYVSGRVSDLLVEGGSHAKAVIIITDRWQAVAGAIMEQLERGVTGLSSRGMYTGQDRQTLMCVAGRREIVRLKEIIARTDPAAFVMVSDVREVLGEGFSVPGAVRQAEEHGRG